MVIDGLWATVGTLNFDNRSLAFNDESNLLVEDARFARTLEQIYLDDLRNSREFKLELFNQRSLSSKFLDAASARVAKLL
jgi:cardiolipin synthase